jgi:porphobilinogen deaminase
LAPLDDATRAATAAERGVSLGSGSCQVPLAHAESSGNRMRLRALVGNASTGEYVEAEASGTLDQAEDLAKRAVAHLKERGALRLLGMA